LSNLAAENFLNATGGVCARVNNKMWSVNVFRNIPLLDSSHSRLRENARKFGQNLGFWSFGVALYQGKTYTYPQPRTPHPINRMSIAWILGAAATAAAALITERRLIYKPVRHVLQNPGHLDLDFEDVTFAASDGTALNGWWLPRAGASGTILHCHGNKGSLADRAWIARDLATLPYNVFMFDYRGYGLSRGIPTAAGTRLDVLAAWEEVRRRHGGADRPPIALFGSSLGGATAAQLAAERPVRCLVLEGTFTSTLDMGRRFYPWLFPRLTCHNRYDTLAKIRTFTMPLLVAHSPDDAVIPFIESQELAADGASTLIAVGLDHFMTDEDALGALADALDRLAGIP